MLANVYVGDYYNDGHGLYETITLEINKTPEEWQEALQEMEKRNGFNFREFVCGDYQEHFIKKSTVERLQAMGVSFEGLDDYESGWGDGEYSDPDKFYLYETGTLVELLMRYVKTRLKDLEWSFIKPPPTLCYSIGYGMFD